MFCLVLLTTLVVCIQGNFHHIEKRMVLGQFAKVEDWPFAAWLVKDNIEDYPRYCGASLIADKWLVTAGHCVDGIVDRPSTLTVQIGSAKRLRMKRNKKFHHNVTRIYLHPNYEKELIQNDDIALIELDKPVVLHHHSHIRPVRLALWTIRDSNKDEFKCKVAGWGKDGKFDSLKELKNPRSKPSKRLKYANVPILPKDRCLQSFNTNDGGSLVTNGTIFWNMMFCGGSKDEKVGTACLHDSGSPLICKDKYGNYDLHGVTIAIHGPNINDQPCAPGKQIMIFIRISYYSQWILSILNKD